MNTGKRVTTDWLARCMLCFTFVATTLGLSSMVAQAELTLVPNSFEVIASNSVVPELDVYGGTHYVANPDDLNTQAGSHPFAFTTRFRFESETSTNPNDYGGLVNGGNLKDLSVDLPVGFVGNPNAIPTCSQVTFNSRNSKFCPADTQIGIAVVDTGFGPEVSGVYNVEPSAGEPARLGFIAAYSVPVNLQVYVRSDGDYGLRVRVKDLPEALPVISTSLTLWGVPASSVHDVDRWIPATFGGSYGGPSNAPRAAFLTNPANCSAGAQSAYMTFDSWQLPGKFTTVSSPQPAITGCESLSFDPSIKVTPDTTQAGAPVGLNVDVGLPQIAGADTTATASLRKAVVTLPPGMTISPSAANGLLGCSDAQFAIKGLDRAACLDGSKIGTATLQSPLLRAPMRGSIFLGQPLDSNPQSGRMFRIFVELNGAGVSVKLSGAIVADPVTGQLTTTFDENPELPFNLLTLAFAGGPAASLSNPKVCGPAVTTSTMTSYGGQVRTPGDSFEVTGCSAPQFSPSFQAGTTNPSGGAHSPFSLTFARADADAFFGSITVRLPEGLLGTIASVPLCSEVLAAAGSCGSGSLIGTARTAAGPGIAPFALPGRVYLTGPYKGGPFGLSIVVPALAGPFDLGTVVVRAALYIDRSTTELTAVSDPLPTILAGIPLQIRSVSMLLDRPGFILNPTDCTPARVNGQISSVAGALAAVASRFQVGSCSSLPFKPRMGFKVGTRGRTGAGVTTPLEVSLTMTRGQANNRVVQVVLPKALNSRLEVVNRRSACTIEQFRADRCPTVIGTGTAVTPLLRDPVRGPAYFVYNPARRLPDLVVRLKGQVDVDLVGKVSIPKNLSLQTTFDLIPDVPITKFSLRFVSGRNGAIGVVQNLCSARTRRGLKASIEFTGQNGKRIDQDQQMRVAGCSRASGRARARRDGERTAARRNASRRGGAKK